MKKIYFPDIDIKKNIDIHRLKEDINLLAEERRKSKNYWANTEATLFLILRGSVDYFENLDENFLGTGNSAGIPDINADNFANNIYRLFNTIDYFCKILKMEIDSTDEIMLLKDVRTLIVHSGEQITNIKSLELSAYKDIQLGRIISKNDRNSMIFTFDMEYDYNIQVWSDKHSNGPKRENDWDYNAVNEVYKDVDIYLNHNNVKLVVLNEIEQFLNAVFKRKKEVQIIKQIPIQLVETIPKNLDLEKIEQLIYSKKRGGFYISQGVENWDGFGIKRLLDYIESTVVEKSIKLVIEDVIKLRIKDFLDSYNDQSILDEELPSLNVINIFEKFIPQYPLRYYLQEKMFYTIAPSFNTRNGCDATDIDYLLRFVTAANEVLYKPLNLENTANGVICDYIVKCIETYNLSMVNKEK